MANGFLAGSKGALIFAGVVILFAVAVAGTLADRFTPGDGDEYGEEQSEESSGEEAKRPSEREPDAEDEYDDYADEESLFGDYEPGSENEELIDDTAGFDTAPGDSGGSASREDEVDDDEGDAAPPRGRSARRTGNPSGKAVVIPANVRPENISVEQMKRYVLQPPRLGKSEG